MTRLQVLHALVLTIPWVAISMWLALKGWYLAALPCSFILFMSGLRQSHDAFHRTLGLTKRQNEWFLCLLSLVMMIPLHAVKFNHLRHHAHPLDPEDIEGSSARVSWWKAIALGPIFTLKMLFSAAREGDERIKRWMSLESALLFALIGVAIWNDWRWMQYHVAVMAVGNCLTGFFAVWLVHHDCEPTGVYARTQRGWLVNALTLHLFYHMEHHLFPAVPACHLPELAKRLEAQAPEVLTKQVIGPGTDPSGRLHRLDSHSAA